MFAAEGHFSGQHFIKENAERKNIRARIDFSSIDLFGRHVRKRADSAGGSRQFQRTLQLCQAEIHHLDFVLRRHHHIICFDVAMDDVLGMCFMQRFADLDRVLRCCVERERPFGKFFPERHPLHIFHHDELTLLTVRFVFLYGIDRADIRMIQHGGRLRFAEKTVIVLLRERILRGEEFQRNNAVEVRVFGLIDNAHAPFT